MPFWNLAVIQKTPPLLAINNFWAMYSYLLWMAVADFLSDCSYNAASSCNLRTPEAALQNETEG